MTTVFQPVVRESARDRVYADLRDAILTGRIRTGQRLAEVPLSKQFQVNRAVVREAFQQLAHEGLIDRNPFAGARVVNLTPEQVDEIIGLRVLLECEAVRQAKPRLTPKDKGTLRRLARKVEDSAGNAATHARRDLEFHEALWTLTGNKTLHRHLSQLTAPLFAMGTIVRHSRAVEIEGANLRADHIGLAETVCEGGVEEAVEAIRTHIVARWNVIRSFLERYHEAGAGGRGGNTG